VLATLDLAPRQELMSRLFTLVQPSIATDSLTIEVMLEAGVEPFVFVLHQSKLGKALRRSYGDVVVLLNERLVVLPSSCCRLCCLFVL